jgi:hypothetical protein
MLTLNFMRYFLIALMPSSADRSVAFSISDEVKLVRHVKCELFIDQYSPNINSANNFECRLSVSNVIESFQLSRVCTFYVLFKQPTKTKLNSMA